MSDAQSELAALREENCDALAVNLTLNKQMDALIEELAECKQDYRELSTENDRLLDAASAAEQRNADLCKLLLRVQGVCLFSLPDGMHSEIDAALKPTESGARE